MKKKLKTEGYFKLLKPIGIYKVGELFDSYNGIVSGVGDISFTNKEYFKLLK